MVRDDLRHELLTPDDVLVANKAGGFHVAIFEDVYSTLSPTSASVTNTESGL